MSDIIDLLKAKEKEIDTNITQAMVKTEEIKKDTSAEVSRIKIEADENTEKELGEMSLDHQKDLKIKVEKIERLGREASEVIDKNAKKHYEDAVKMVFETITKNT